VKKLYSFLSVFILSIYFIPAILIASSDPVAQMQFTYNVNSCLAEENVTGSSSISFVNGMAVLQVSQNGDSATISNNIRAYAQPGQSVSCIFAAIYGNEQGPTNQIAGIGNATDGFFFQCSNSTFGILYRNNSIDVTIPQNNWNVDPMDGSGPSGMTLNFTLGNIFKIQYQRLEFGNIKFFIESSSTGELILVHQINYANANTNPSLSNPGLQLMAEVQSSGGNAELSISSMSVFIEGEVNPYLGIRNGVGGSKTVNTSSNNILTIQNDTIFESQTNQLMVIPDQLSLYSSPDNTGEAIFSLYLNPTVDNPIFSNISSNSVVSYDTSGTSVNGGILLGAFYLPSGSSRSVDLTKYNIKLSPGDTLVFACTSTSSDIVVYISVSWLEQF
jgi:hypothetical protein